MPHYHAPPFLSLPAVQTVFALARQIDGEARLVGGCIRDHILGRTTPDFDIDMAVNVPITALMNVAEKEGIRVLETGLSHGSVTLMIDNETIEVTQTRADIAPEGRRTQIGFTADWREDAQRRDFTINALYVDEAGKLYDDVEGMADLQAMRLRFIGEPTARIEEDYLRILRALRFVAQMPELALSPEALRPMAEKAERLSTLSGERVHAELKKSFSASGWNKAVLLMRETAIDRALFDAPFTLFDDKMIETQHKDKWLVILACLLRPEAVIAQIDRLRLSRREAQMLSQIVKPFTDEDWALLTSDRWAEFAYLNPFNLGARAIVFAAHHSPSCQLDEAHVRQIDLFAPPPCPVSGHDLIHAGVPAGKSMGEYIDHAKRYFAASQFKASKDEILRHVLAR